MLVITSSDQDARYGNTLRHEDGSLTTRDRAEAVQRLLERERMVPAEGGQGRFVITLPRSPSSSSS